ncbi:FAD-dependent oxidoreductase [Candidatus Saccharibacteria bacterium]|nr:FAD-dependent oxidoreductase [Candidatus Saccharibacteria bacterium]
MEKYDIAVIGAGIAGLTAAIYAVRAGKSTIVLEGKMEGGQIINTINIENWPGDMRVSGVDLIRKVKAQAEELGAKIDYVNVEKISAMDGGFEILGDMDEKILVSSVILAMGTNPRKLSDAMMKDAGKRPVSYCATCDGALYKGKNVVVVGHGNSAKHEVKYLEGICNKVYNIHHDEKIPEDADAVFVAIGRIPATECAKGLVEIDGCGYIVAGEDCHTTQPGVFVAGDARTKTVRQLVTAAGDGAVAAEEAVRYLA